MCPGPELEESTSHLEKNIIAQEKKKIVFHTGTWQSISRYQGKLLCTATTSVDWRISSTPQIKKKRSLHRQKARIHIEIKIVDLYFQ